MKCSCGCGRPVRKGGTMSATCYQKQYRKTASGMAATKRANKKWRETNPERTHYYDTIKKKEWRQKTNFYVPQEIHELRKAVKNLEKALAKTDQC